MGSGNNDILGFRGGVETRNLPDGSVERDQAQRNASRLNEKALWVGISVGIRKQPFRPAALTLWGVALFHLIRDARTAAVWGRAGYDANLKLTVALFRGVYRQTMRELSRINQQIKERATHHAQPSLRRQPPFDQTIKSRSDPQSPTSYWGAPAFCDLSYSLGNRREIQFRSLVAGLLNIEEMLKALNRENPSMQPSNHHPSSPLPRSS